MDEADGLEFTLFWITIAFLVVRFIGNLLVIQIVHKTWNMYTPTNYLLANMAVSDVITILLWPFYFLEFSKFICKFFALIVERLLFTVERYHSLLKPFRTGLRLTEDTIGRAIAFIWIARVIICFPEFFLKEWSDANATCIGPAMNQISSFTTRYGETEVVYHLHWFGSRFGQLVSKIPYCDIPFGTGVYHLQKSLPFTFTESLELVSKMRFDEMEHEFLLEHSLRESRTTFSDIPLFPEIFHSNDPKSRVPFTFRPKFPDSQTVLSGHIALHLISSGLRQKLRTPIEHEIDLKAKIIIISRHLYSAFIPCPKALYSNQNQNYKTINYKKY